MKFIKILTPVVSFVTFIILSTACEKQKDNLAENPFFTEYTTPFEVPPFDEQNPSAENIARWLFLKLKVEVNTNSTRVKRVEICEMEGCGASYFE